MLAPGRIQFETPNVIDPGEMPPGRPSRPERNFEDEMNASVRSSQSSNSGSELGGYNRQPQFSRFERIRIDFRSDADEEPGDQAPPSRNDSDGHDQESLIRHDAPPSPASSRRFAETMLTEYERRQSQRNLNDPMNWPKRGRRNRRQSVEPSEDKSRLKVRMERQLLYYRIFFLVSIVAIVSGLIASMVLAKKKQIANVPRSSSRMSATLNILASSGISDENDLLLSTSPQHKAAKWIADEDLEPLDIPTSIDDSPSSFVQRYVLAVLFNALDGNNWSDSLKFMSKDHECGWFMTSRDDAGETYAVGVECNNQLQVRSLLMPSNNLKGRIPSEIQHLSKLEFLGLKQNQLTGSIPSGLKELSLLDYLDLKYNQLTGTIPDFFGGLVKLKVLGLTNNQLHGSLPASMEFLDLTTLAIDDNLLTGSLVPVLSMSALEYFYADNNNFEGNFDDLSFSALQGLTELDLSGNHLQVSSEIPTYFFTLSKLRVLDLSGNEISGSLPTYLPENRVLEYLSLRDNSMSSTIPKSISGFRALTHLDLEDNKFTGNLPESIGNLTDLSYLFLGKNLFNSGPIPESFQFLTKLQELSLDTSRLQGKIPRWIENFVDLKLLDLRMNQLTGSIDVYFSKLKDLTFLMLSDNNLTGSVPVELGSLPALSVVSLHHNEITGEAGHICQADAGTKLVTTDCANITCVCCDTCCDNVNCYNDTRWDALENNNGAWEEHFGRSNYSFNPHILYDN